MRPNKLILISLLFSAALLSGTGRPASAGSAETLARGDGPVRAPHSNLLLPAGATLVTDESRNMPALPAPGGIASSGAREKVLTLNVVEGHMATAVSLAAVVDLYRREGVLTAGQKPA